MIKKSYKLIEFGNKDHNILVLLCIAIFAFTLTFVSTFSLSCAKLSFNQVFKRNVKSALRRVAWFVRNSYLKLRLINDDNFDFTEDLDFNEVLIIEKFLKKRETKLKKENFLAEYLFLLSYKLHFFAKNKDIKGYSKYKKSELIDLLNENSENNITEKKNKNENINGSGSTITPFICCFLIIKRLFYRVAFVYTHKQSNVSPFD